MLSLFQPLSYRPLGLLNALKLDKPPQTGFTLIELLVTIAAITTMTAVALPRLIDLNEDAEYRFVERTTSNFALTVTSVHAYWVLNGAVTVTHKKPGHRHNTGQDFRARYRGNSRCEYQFQANTDLGFTYDALTGEVVFIDDGNYL